MSATVGDGLVKSNAAWTFGQGIAPRFDDHVSKSVPLYNEGHDLVVALSDFFVNSGAIYEIGCSTGTLTLKLASHNINKSGARFIGIDIEPEMIEFAKGKADQTARHAAEFMVGDALTMDFEPTDMIVAYYVVQFIHPSARQRLIDRLYKALNWGGALVMFEKVRGPDARFQDIVTSLYTDYKVARGYSAEEILGKARSLKGILEPFSTQGNIDMLRRAGFQDVMSIMKYVCFEGFLAIK